MSTHVWNFRRHHPNSGHLDATSEHSYDVHVVERDDVRISIVVPATDDSPTLAQCLAAIAAADGAPDELLVVTAPCCGPASARNEGARRATGDILVFVDADVVIHTDALGPAALGSVRLLR
jgi:cellulose synthase/poly-beta-1,6-N-acetylglucosamine synthase-like glycosyltransferase